MREALGRFSPWLWLLPQTPEKGVCFDVLGTQRRGRSDGEERGDLDYSILFYFFFPPFLALCEGFSHMGANWEMSAGPSPGSISWWGGRCEPCPLEEAGGPDPAPVETEGA